RVSRVEVPCAVGDVLRREEHLTDGDGVTLEGRLVVPHEGRLTDGRGRLLLGNRLGPFVERQSGHTRDDRARRDQDDLSPVPGRGDFGGQRIDPALIGAGRGGRDEAAAHLYHQSAARG